MRAILCDITALNYWRQASAAGGPRSLRWLALTPEDMAASALPQRTSHVQVDPPTTSLAGLLDHHGLATPEQPARLLVARRKDVRNHPCFTCKVWSTPLPERSLFPVVLGGTTLRDIYVASPELAMLQFCSYGRSTHDLLDALVCAMELCGSYRMLNGELVPGCPALATPKSLGELARQTHGRPGSSQLAKVARLTHANSASPAETSLTLALSLPYRLGGAHLPISCLNPTLSLNEAGRRMLGRETISPDMLLQGPNGTRLVIEYDSKSWHDSREQAEYDERRRNAYAALGFKCIIVRPRHLANPLQFEAIVASARTNLGVRLQKPPANYYAKCHDTQDLLFEYWRRPFGLA